MKETKPCRHCGNPKTCRPRGLCWPCYYAPGVKEQYPITSKYARRGVGSGGGSNSPLPAEPTTAPPGTAEKLAVMTERAARGESLHHPLDATSFTAGYTHLPTIHDIQAANGRLAHRGAA